MWANFHMHCNFCDGSDPIQSYADVAVSSGVLSLGFSSHAPLPFDCKWCMQEEKLSRYLDEIQSLKQVYPSLQLYKGLEVDFIPSITEPKKFESLLDYTIGAIHFVDQYANGRHWEIDGQHTTFLDGFEKIFKNNSRDAITRYFELTREMVINSPPDVVGHLDKIKIQNIGNKLFNESDRWYQEEVKKTLSVIADAGCIIEANTRGIYQNKTTTPYPSPWILEMAEQMKIPVTLSSDAHHPKDITRQFQETASLLSSIGFNEIHILRDSVWSPVAFTENGIA